MASKNAPAAHQKHLAVPIDADNAPAAIVEVLFEEIAKYGVYRAKSLLIVISCCHIQPADWFTSLRIPVT